jgi:hypothetical protein
MAYSDFTIASVKQRLGLTLVEDQTLFPDIAPQPLPALLKSTLEQYLPLALNLGTEKARSELLIAPILAGLKLQYPKQLAFFSGIEFNIDESLGLKGRCDYVLSQNPEQLVLSAPVCVLVEAKNENIVGGIGQCLAEMVAAQRFNQAQDTPLDTLYGVVSSGINWRFLRLIDRTAWVDSREYGIQQAEWIYAILARISGVHPA